MKIYNYDDEKKFMYEEDARINPLETEALGKDVYLLPAKATFKKALEAKEGFDVVFNEEEDKWEYKEIPIIKDEEPLPKEKTEKQKLQEAIWELEGYLISTDYKIIKAVELNEPLDKELKSKRQSVRDDINNLKKQLSQEPMAQETMSQEPMAQESQTQKSQIQESLIQEPQAQVEEKQNAGTDTNSR